MAMTTPLKRARGLGSAHEGPGHFIKQRVTAAANIILFAFAVGLIVALAGADLATVKATLAHPLVAIGSYPHFSSPEYKVKVTLESKDAAALAAAVAALLAKLDHEQLVRSE